MDNNWLIMIMIMIADCKTKYERKDLLKFVTVLLTEPDDNPVFPWEFNISHGVV